MDDHFPTDISLSAIRFLLYDLSKTRYYRYTIEVSTDGTNFEPLVDRSKGQWSGWQIITFPPRPVKAIKLRGLYCNDSSNFHVVEFEAYCRSTPQR